jgi:hypothetical protein
VSSPLPFCACLTIDFRSRAAHASQGVPGGRVHRIREPSIPTSPRMPFTSQPPRDVPAATTARSNMAAPPAPSVARSYPASAATPMPSHLRAAPLPLQGPLVSPASSATGPDAGFRSRPAGKTYVVFEGLAPSLYDSWHAFCLNMSSLITV